MDLRNVWLKDVRGWTWFPYNWAALVFWNYCETGDNGRRRKCNFSSGGERAGVEGEESKARKGTLNPTSEYIRLSELSGIIWVGRGGWLAVRRWKELNQGSGVVSVINQLSHELWRRTNRSNSPFPCTRPTPIPFPLSIFKFRETQSEQQRSFTHDIFVFVILNFQNEK